MLRIGRLREYDGVCVRMEEKTIRVLRNAFTGCVASIFIIYW